MTVQRFVVVHKRPVGADFKRLMFFLIVSGF